MAEDEAVHARRALKAYMEWWSETYYAASWLRSLDRTLRDAGDETYLWLVEKAGGTYGDGEAFIEDAEVAGG